MLIKSCNWGTKDVHILNQICISVLSPSNQSKTGVFHCGYNPTIPDLSTAWEFLLNQAGNGELAWVNPGDKSCFITSAQPAPWSLSDPLPASPYPKYLPPFCFSTFYLLSSKGASYSLPEQCVSDHLWPLSQNCFPVLFFTVYTAYRIPCGHPRSNSFAYL